MVPFDLLQEEYLSRCLSQLNFKFRLNGRFSPSVPWLSFFIWDGGIINSSDQIYYKKVLIRMLWVLWKPQQARKATDETNVNPALAKGHSREELYTYCKFKNELRKPPFRSTVLKLLASGFLFLAGCCFFWIPKAAQISHPSLYEDKPGFPSATCYCSILKGETGPTITRPAEVAGFLSSTSF